MKFVTFVTALAVAIPAAFGLTISTPSSVVECEPTQFNWSGGSAPYYLTLIPARQTAASAIKQFPTQNGTSYTWLVDLQAGTSFTISLKDSSGNTAYSDIVTVQAGTSSSCVNTSVQETGGSGGSGGSGAASTGAGGSSAATDGASASVATNTLSSATSTASSSTPTHSSAAGRLGVSSAFGVAGVMGLVGAALF